MAVKQHTCFVANCDGCGNKRENGECIVLHYDSAEEAIEAALEADWHQLPDERLLCTWCTSKALKNGEIKENPDEDSDFVYVLSDKLR